MSVAATERFTPILSSPVELDRVRLRGIGEADADAIFPIYSDGEVARYLSHPAWTDRTQAVEWVEKVRAGYSRGSSIQLGIERKSDRALIGTCLLFNFHEQSRRAEIGYALGRPYWSQGYIHEALTALVDIGFGRLDLNRLEADIDPRNDSSARTLERLGFTKEGYCPERWIVAGVKSDTALFGLLRKDWAATSRT